MQIPHLHTQMCTIMHRFTHMWVNTPMHTHTPALKISCLCGSPSSWVHSVVEKMRRKKEKEKSIRPEDSHLRESKHTHYTLHTTHYTHTHINIHTHRHTHRCLPPAPCRPSFKHTPAMNILGFKWSACVPMLNPQPSLFPSLWSSTSFLSLSDGALRRLWMALTDLPSVPSVFMPVFISHNYIIPTHLYWTPKPQ